MSDVKFLEHILNGDAGPFRPIQFDTAYGGFSSEIGTDLAKGIRNFRDELNCFVVPYDPLGEDADSVLWRRQVEKSVMSGAHSVFNTVMQQINPFLGQSKESWPISKEIYRKLAGITAFGPKFSFDLDGIYNMLGYSTNYSSLVEEHANASSIKPSDEKFQYLMLNEFLKHYRLVTYLNLLTFPLDSLNRIWGIVKSYGYEYYFRGTMGLGSRDVFKSCKRWLHPLSSLGLSAKDYDPIRRYMLMLDEISRNFCKVVKSEFREFIRYIISNSSNDASLKHKFLGLFTMLSLQKLQGKIPIVSELDDDENSRFQEMIERLDEERSKVREKIKEAAVENKLPLSKDGIPKVTEYVLSLYESPGTCCLGVSPHIEIQEGGSLKINMELLCTNYNGAERPVFSFWECSSYCKHSELLYLIERAIETKKRGEKNQCS